MVTFGLRGSAENLVSRAGTSGGLILFVCSKRDPVPKEIRGHAMGIIEFFPEVIEAPKVFDLSDRPATHWKEDGTYKWPYGLLARRMWRMEPSIPITDLIGRNLKQTATRHAELLTAKESRVVFSKANLIEEFPAPVTNSYVKVLSRNNDAMRQRAWGAPPPWAGRRNVEIRASQHGFTYLLRFGQRDVWKIGRSRDPASRLREINKYVPSEVLGESWEIAEQLQMPSEDAAHVMEQEILAGLRDFRLEGAGERVLCSEKQVRWAWNSAASHHSRKGRRKQA